MTMIPLTVIYYNHQSILSISTLKNLNYFNKEKLVPVRTAISANMSFWVCSNRINVVFSRVVFLTHFLISFYDAINFSPHFV